MIYVSLSTIPERLKNINKAVDSLLNQTQKPDKIFINKLSIIKKNLIMFLIIELRFDLKKEFGN